MFFIALLGKGQGVFSLSILDKIIKHERNRGIYERRNYQKYR